MSNFMPGKVIDVYYRVHPASVCCENTDCIARKLSIKVYLNTARTDLDVLLHQIENDVEKVFISLYTSHLALHYLRVLGEQIFLHQFVESTRQISPCFHRLELNQT